MEPPPVIPARARFARRNAVTLKLLFIAGLVLLLHVPLRLVNALQEERAKTHARSIPRFIVEASPRAELADHPVFEAYRTVGRALKYALLVLALVFTAFFLFEMLGGLRLHPAQYGLVGAALCLFYLALLALGEVTAAAAAYTGAAVASSSLIVLYSAAILRSWLRAGVIAALLGAVHSVLFVVLRMEDFALIAGTATLFAALGAVMFFTRHVDWHAQEAGSAAGSEVGR
ncbi:MAG: inner membrane CreD family protein [Opitutaceae bacterium]|nr:inner membrane CreD family protein [Opitutaceae bacterium]